MNRQEAEEYLGVSKPIKVAKVGRRYHAAPSWAPSHWPKTLRLWAKAVFIFVCAWIVIGMGAGIIERVWP